MIFRPDLRVARILLRHDRQHNDCSDKPAHGERQRNTVDQRDKAIPKTHNRTTRPIDQLEHDKHLPRAPLYVPVSEQVHGDRFVAQHGAHGRARQEPRTGIQVSGEEAGFAAAGSAQDGGPVVDAAGGGHGGGEFGERGGDCSVEDADEDEAV